MSINKHCDLIGLKQESLYCRWLTNGLTQRQARYEGNSTYQMLESGSGMAVLGQALGFNLFDAEVDYPIKTRACTSSNSLCRFSNTAGLQVDEQSLDLSGQHLAGQVICSVRCAGALGVGSSRTEPGA